MRSDRISVAYIAGVALCATACLAGPIWLGLPAAAILLLWIPGRMFMRLLGDVDAAPGRAWLAVAASMILMPVPLSWIWQISNERLAILGGVAAINLVLIFLAGRAAARPRATCMFGTWRGRAIFTAIVLWSAACVFGSYWLPTAGGRTRTVAAHDYIKHHAVMLSLERYPLPLHNIFYAAEADTPYYYYEYHYLVPAALRKMTGDRASIAMAFGLSSAVVAAVFIALAFLIARNVLGSGRGALLSAACVSIVGGWDVIPVLIRMLAGGPKVIVLDSWCPVAWRIHNLMTQFMWCPQHVSAVIGLMLGCLWLRQAPSARWWVIVAPLLAASIFGSSVYLAITIFLAALIYMAMRFFGDLAAVVPLRRRLLALAAMAAAGAALMGPQAWRYYVMSQRYAGGLTLQWEHFDFALLGRLVPAGPIANLLDAPWLILIEFGLPAAACVLVARKVWSAFWQDPGGRLLILAGALGTVGLFCIRSDINPIDYSFRIAIMPAMVVAAVLAGALIEPEHLRRFARTWRKEILVTGVILGLPVGFYEAPLMAVRTFLLDEPRAADADAIRYLREQTPKDAVVQCDPEAAPRLVQLIDRQIGVSDPIGPNNAHVRVFQPVDVDRMYEAAAEVEYAFLTDSSREAYAFLRAQRVTHVLAGSIERKRFGEMHQFEDAGLFAIVYEDEEATVYRLLGRPGTTQDVPQPGGGDFKGGAP